MKTPKSGLRPLNSLASWWEQRGFSLSSYMFDKKG
jgi:hypothetical protein